MLPEDKIGKKFLKFILNTFSVQLVSQQMVNGMQFDVAS